MRREKAMGRQSVRIASAILSVLLLPGVLQAGPVVKIRSVDAASYPDLKIAVSLKSPYPGFASAENHKDDFSKTRKNKLKKSNKNKKKEVKKKSIEITDGQTTDRSLSSEGIRFKVYETLGGQERELPVASSRERPSLADRIHLSIVLDSTLSVSSSAFQRAKQDASTIVSRLPDGSGVTLYSFNGKPVLVSKFTRDREYLRSRIAGVERNGQTTRIYDALYAGIYSALNVPDQDGGVQARSVVLLMTDGRDEGSYITPSDLQELLRTKGDRSIPVYTIFYGQPGSRSLFHRLAMKSGGGVFRDPGAEDLDKILRDMRQIPDRTFEILTKHTEGSSPISIPSGISRNASVRVELVDDGITDSDTASFQLPETSGTGSMLLHSLSDRQNLYLLIGSVLGLLLILGLSLWLVRFFKKRSLEKSIGMGRDPLGAPPRYPAPRESGREEPSELEEPDMDRVHPVRDILAEEEERRRVLLEEQKKRMVEPEPRKAPASRYEDERPEELEEMEEEKAFPAPKWEERPVRSRSGADQEPRRSPAARPEERYPEEDLHPDELDPYLRHAPPGSRKKDQPSIYMREHAYYLLQMALRKGVRYGEATLELRRDARSSARQDYDIFLDSTVIGSGRWANIRLEDPSVSPSHAKIRKVDNKFVIYDLMSGTGVYVNNRKILRPRALLDGDEIRMGRSVFHFKGMV